jgi:tetratricopeptide (TPR) repeat protein
MTTASAAPAPPPAAAPSPWILGVRPDLLLIVATPILVLPVMLGAEALFASASISAFVMAFGAMGHHLPGMLRAYGDRDLFARFRTRFVLAPVVLAVLCVGFALRGSQGMLFVAYAWGVWHGFMQTYGFMRIYDAKVRSVARATARLDFAMCAAWFAGGVLMSDSRVHYVQAMLWEFGVAPLPRGVLLDARLAFGLLLGALTLLFLWNAARRARAGARANPIKFLLLAVGVLWWWYANVAVTDILLGLILFEVFHDVQYLTIVWLYTRRRVAESPGIGGFTRFLFRRSPGLVALYVALVFAYGGLGPLAKATLSSPAAVAVAKGLITASALLHFYFDGFIWKVREAPTRRGLGLDDAGAGETRAARRHGLKWAFLLLPAGALWAFDGSGDGNPVDRATALSASAPGAAAAWFELGTAREAAGDAAGAVAAFERSLAIFPHDPNAADNLLVCQLEAGRQAIRERRDADAERFLRPVAAARPSLAHEAAADAWRAWQARRHDDAVTGFRTALALDPELAEAHLNLALVYREQRAFAPALDHARRGAALLRGDARAQELVRMLEQDVR